MAHRIDVTTTDLEFLKEKLSAILTRETAPVSELIRKVHADEALKVLSAFNEASGLLESRQWTGPLLAHVSVQSWVARDDGEMHVAPNSDASLRYLALQPLPEKAVHERRQIEFREKFMKLLVGNLGRLIRKQYLPALQWVPHHQVADEGVRGQPLASEIAFGHDLDFLEKQMDAYAHKLDEQWGHERKWPKDQALPAAVIREHSKLALEHIKLMVEGWLAENAEEVPDSLIALTMMNLGANRALLEYARLDACGHEAAEMVVGVLRELNRQGIDEVPFVMEGLDRRQGQEMLRTLLHAWFGPGGSVLSSQGLFVRPMVEGEIDLVSRWSVQVQDSYIAGRGHRGGPASARAIHGSSRHLFIFALGIVAAFYTKTKVPQEFAGKKTPKHSLFPGRNAIASGESESPSTHALKVLEQAYSLMFFGNTDWNLFAKGVSERAAINSLRRAHLQQLIFFVVKNRPSSQLLLISRRINQLRECRLRQLESH
jgi:hypothetical protein